MPWLDRSGQRWKLKGARVRGWTGFILFWLGFLGSWPPGVFIGLPLVVSYYSVMLIRCRVCGLRLSVSKAALNLPTWDRVGWLRSLESCPECGDDGRATREAKEDWRRSGRVVEGAYWTRTRIVLALLLTLILAGGGFAIGILQRHP